MGLEIGYNVWKKKKNKLVKHKLTEEQDFRTWVCGRCDVTYAWEYGCSWDYQNKKSVEAVFNKEFDGYALDTLDPEYSRTLKYVDFEDFKNHIMQVVNEEYDIWKKGKESAFKRISELEKQIKEYQELQLRTTTDVVFDKFQEKIDDCREYIAEDQRYIDIECEDDYDYTHAKAVEEMLKDIEKYLKKGFVITTFFSY